MMNLTKKQQIQIIAIALALIVLIWQLRSFYSETIISAAPATRPVAEHSAPAKATPASNSNAINYTVAPIVASNQAQGDYLRLVNEYQLIQMQRMIAEGYEAIAVARRNTAKAISETAQITGSSAMPGTEISRSSGDFELIYTGQEGGQWTATLKKGNQTFDVVPGTVIGNLRVSKIDDSSVTVTQGGNMKVITFNDAYPIAPETVDAAKQSNNALDMPLTKQEQATLAKPAAIVPAVPNKTTAETKTLTPASDAAAVVMPTAPVIKPAIQAQPAKIVTPAPVADKKAETAAVVIPATNAKATVVVTPPAKAVAVVAPMAATKPAEKDHAVNMQSQKTAQLPLVPVAAKVAAPAAAAAVVSATDKNDLKKLAIVTNTPQTIVAVTPPTQAKPAPLAVKVDDADAKILALPADHYTIQLIADAKLANLKSFAKRHNIEDKALYFKTQKAGKNWHVLIYGDYPNFVAANTALENLSDSLQQWDPFIRKMASIHAAIKGASK